VKMMTKQHYQIFASALSLIKNNKERDKILSFLLPLFKQENYKFSEGVFREWIRREIKGENLKGLKSQASKHY